MTTIYNLYEVTFANNFSICIKSLSTIETPDHIEKLNVFLANDIAKNGQVIDVIPIDQEEAEKFFDLSNFNNWPVFNVDSRLNDPWFAYELGDTYHNSNGRDYIILAMDKDKDKMILARKSKLGDKDVTFFIGAKGIYMHSWSFGHYFMQNFEAACNWFNEEDQEDKGTLVKDFMEMYMGPENSTIFICNSNTFKYYQFIDSKIPTILMDSKIHNIAVKEFCVNPTEEFEDQEYITSITLYIDFEANDINTMYFTEDYGSHEL